MVPVRGGHNYGECRKCGKVHKHPRGMLGKKHSKLTKLKMHKSHVGKPSPTKGKKNPKVAEAMRNRIWTPEMRAKMSKAMTGKPHNRPHLTALHRQRIGLAMTAHYLKVHTTEVRQYYGISKGVVFFPLPLREHKFAREVLIKKTESYSLLPDYGVAHAEWITNNLQPNAKLIELSDIIRKLRRKQNAV